MIYMIYMIYMLYCTSVKIPDAFKHRDTMSIVDSP